MLFIFLPLQKRLNQVGVTHVDEHILPQDFFITGPFTKLGNSLVYYSHEKMNWEEAKAKCEEMDSSLVEIWTEQEFIEVQ